MSFPKYPTYRDSGATWLGKVPEHWAITRVGVCFDERREKVSDKDYEPLSVTKDGVVPQLETAAKTDDGDNRKRVLEGDFVINSRSDRKGSAGLAPRNGSVSLICTVLKPRSTVLGRFAHFLLRSVPFQEEYYRFGKGIVADLWSTNYGEMRNIVLALPSLLEQRQIAAFLGRETAKIDALVSEQERLIELLQEKRQAVISQAVTKGLNPDVPMKTAGVEWIDRVPVHWEVLKLGLLGTLKGGAGFPDEYQGVSDCEIPFFKVADIGAADSSGVMRVGNHTVSSETAGLLRARIFPSNAIVFAKVGAALLLQRFRLLGQPSCIDNNMMGMEVSERVAPEFLLRVLPLLDLALVVNPGAVPSVNERQIAGQRIALPPRSEQMEIVRYLDCETAKFGRLIANAQALIALLQERRSALISAAVTGQIDVRNLVEQEAA